ncbi:MAG: hypothetical protein NTY01_10245 [Verrucomicrobia bacterium]|nr:hypothetical protein [Verrucomicrobiota bacterium]
MAPLLQCLPCAELEDLAPQPGPGVPPLNPLTEFLRLLQQLQRIKRFHLADRLHALIITGRGCSDNLNFHSRPQIPAPPDHSTTPTLQFLTSDRAIREYCRDIWRVEPVHVPDGEPAC